MSESWDVIDGRSQIEQKRMSVIRDGELVQILTTLRAGFALKRLPSSLDGCLNFSGRHKQRQVYGCFFCGRYATVQRVLDGVLELQTGTINYMVEKGVTPYANLDLLNASEERCDGLLNIRVVRDYATYVDFCFKMFGDIDGKPDDL
ncbi:hypothetical protein C5167_020337 [Papaver somniferum]|uniref:Uncharacterized protein n=1 Tax=Papaver somniferum TaxID=3469 RepID=A0A4Y7IUV3_PAPSO|nr:hypothetical protein C5167_020337 [Papaver somniferum]